MNVFTYDPWYKYNLKIYYDIGSGKHFQCVFICGVISVKLFFIKKVK